MARRSLAVVAACLAACRAQTGLEIGVQVWGFDIIIPESPRQCEPYIIYYNYTNVHNPTLGDLTYPGSGQIFFSTPDAAQTQWMVLSPPLGVGYMTWTCNLAVGTQFSISAKNLIGYSDVYAVESGESSACVEDAPPASLTTQFAYGSIVGSVYQTFTTQSYTISSSSVNPFRTVPSPTASFSTITVPLGVDLASGGPTSAPSSSELSPSGQTGAPGSTTAATPIGPIIGGVVGGVVTLILIGIVLLLRRRRSRSAAEPAKTAEANDQTPVAPRPLSPFVVPPAAILDERSSTPLSGPKGRWRTDSPALPSTGARSSSPSEVPPEYSVI